MPRPDRLPRSTVKIIDASLVLTCAQKRIWLADFWLDTGPEGSYVKAESLCVRLGMEKAPTVVRYWQELGALGLYVAGPGGLIASRFPTVPADLLPIPHKLDLDTSLRMARRLDDYLNALAAHKEQRTPVRPERTEVRLGRTAVRQEVTRIALAASMEGGVRGGNSPSVCKGVSPSPSEASVNEGEVVSNKDVETTVSEPRARSMSEEEALAVLRAKFDARKRVTR